tara:strand:+ start:839 stop:1063 length:225 start_codon:yes stop_codon:yes gene_type:complete
MTNFKKPVLDSKGKPVKNLFQKDSKLEKLRESLNNMRGVSVAEGVGAAGLKNIAKKIAGVIPLVGTNPRTRKRT